MKEELHSQKLGTMKISKLLLTMSIPAILSMLVQSLYNIVDSVFVAKLGEQPLEALSIAFPLQMLIVAFALGIGIGAKTQIAKSLGEGNVERASNIAKTGLLMAIGTAVIFSVTTLIIAKPFMKAFSEDPEVIRLGIQYISITGGISFGVFIEIFCSKCLQATGNMHASMKSQLIGAVSNIILDPILIFGWFGLPAMGVKGAAIATVIGQLIAMCYIVSVFVFKKQDININFKSFKYKNEYLSAIFKIGVPIAAMNALGSVTVTILNIVLHDYESAITILGIYFKLQSFVFMPMFGLVQGAMPILSYNFGACNKARFAETLKLSFIVAVIFMVIGTILFQFFPNFLMGFFNAKGVLLTEGAFALKVMSVAFIFNAFSTIISSMFQSVGMGLTSLIMSLLRQAILLIPFSILLSNLYGLRGVWWSYPIAEVIGLVTFIPIAIVVFKKKFSDLSKGIVIPAKDIIEMS